MSRTSVTTGSGGAARTARATARRRPRPRPGGACGAGPRFVPHSPQNLAPGGLAAPHVRAVVGQPLPALEAELAARVVLRSAVAAGQHQRRIAVDSGHEEERDDIDAIEAPGRRRRRRRGPVASSARSACSRPPTACRTARWRSSLAIAAAVVIYPIDPAGADRHPPLTGARYAVRRQGQEHARRSRRWTSRRHDRRSRPGCSPAGWSRSGGTSRPTPPRTSRRRSPTAVCGPSS